VSTLEFGQVPPALGQLRGAIRAEEEELDRFASLSRDLLERLERRPRPAGLDEVDGRPADQGARHLCQREIGFLPRLKHRTLADRDSLAAAAVLAVEHGGEHTATLDQSP